MGAACLTGSGRRCNKKFNQKISLVVQSAKKESAMKFLLEELLVEGSIQ